MEDVVPTVSGSVKYPQGRWNIMCALAALSDPEYQEGHWLGERNERTDDWDTFGEVVHTLFDDWGVLSGDPDRWVGVTLVRGPELERLRRLAEALDPLIDRLGHVEDAAYVGDAIWPVVQRLAASALAAMVWIVPGGLAPVPTAPTTDMPVGISEGASKEESPRDA